MDTLDIIKFISKDLSQINYGNLYKLIGDLKLSCILPFKIPKGTKIIRLRPSINIPFDNLSQISYNPNNNDYGRANSPNSIMFYGAVEVPKAYNPLLTSSFEILHILENGKYKIDKDSIELTFGEWITQKEISVVPIIYFQKYLQKNILFKSIYENYCNSFLSNDRDTAIINFIANEFAKSHIIKKSDYKISAVFTDYIMNFFTGNPQGVLYPSVRTDGLGFNIALKPSVIDSRYLKLERVYTMNMYIKGSVGALDGKDYTDKIDCNGKFKLEKCLKDDWNKGREYCLSLIDKN